MKTNKNQSITPEQLNKQLTITRFCLAILTLLILWSCVVSEKKDKRVDDLNVNSDKLNYQSQTEEKPINVTPRD